MSPPTAGRAGVVTASVATAVGLAAGSPLLIVGPWLAVAVWGHWLAVHRRGRARRRIATDLPRYVDAVAQQLKGGGSLARAVATTVGPSSIEARLRPLRAGLDAGLGLGAALRWHQQAEQAAGAPCRDRDPGFALVISTLLVLVERGGPALPSLERLNDTLRTADAIEAEIRIQAGQATASAAVLAGLPVLFMVGLVAAERRLRSFYLFEVGGAACVVVAGGLTYTGWWWMHRMVEGGP